MAAWPVVLKMNVYDYRCARKVRKAVGNMPGVQSVRATTEQGGMVEVHGTADAWALQRRISRKMNRTVLVLSDGSAPYNYNYPGMAPAHYGYAPPPYNTVSTCSIL